MTAFSGTPTVANFTGFGLLVLNKPETIRTKIRKGIVVGIKSGITKDAGYYNDIFEVHALDVANFGDRKGFPSVDVIPGTENYTNSFQGGNSQGGWNKLLDVWIEGYIESMGDPETSRENFLADIEKYLGTYHYIPTVPRGTTAGDYAAFNSILIKNEMFGIESSKPHLCVRALMRVSYRIELTNPNQDF